MALDPRYVISPPFNQFLINKNTGEPLSQGIIASFIDTDRLTPKTVFTIRGTPPNYTYVPLPNPMTLSGVGTVLDDSNNQVVPYFFPFDDDGNVQLYYLVCQDQNGGPQWIREGWPNETSANSPDQLLFSTQNQIANPQFTRTFLTPGANTTLTVSGSNQVFPIAPDWDILSSGTGTIVLQQIPIAGTTSAPTNPPYALDINISTGITDFKLRQKMSTNSGLWASDVNYPIFLSAAVLVQNMNLGTTPITIYYSESTGGSPIALINTTFTSGQYTLLTGASTSPIPSSTNTDQGNAGFIYIYAQLSSSQHIRITSFQIVPTVDSSTAENIGFDNSSANRAQALMGDYFIPQLERKPIPSFLIGWDFATNPAQNGDVQTINATADYKWDQLIAKRLTSDVGITRNSVTKGLSLTTTATNNVFYIMQYLSGHEVKEILKAPSLSVNFNGYVTTVSSPVISNIYLFSAASTATIPLLPTELGILNSDGTFSLTAAGWIPIPRSNLPTPNFTLPSITNNLGIYTIIDAQYNGWQITDNTQLGDTDRFAIVVTFNVPSNATNIVIDSISLCPGPLPTRPAPESREQTLDKCRLYYETTYPENTSPGTITQINAVSNTPMSFVSNPTGFSVKYDIDILLNVEYLTRKRVNNPIIVFYSPTVGTINTIDAYVWALIGLPLQYQTMNNNVAISSAYPTNKSQGSLITSYYPAFVNETFTFSLAITDSAGWIEYHCTIDARYGKV